MNKKQLNLINVRLINELCDCIEGTAITSDVIKEAIIKYYGITSDTKVGSIVAKLKKHDYFTSDKSTLRNKDGKLIYQYIRTDKECIVSDTNSNPDDMNDSTIHKSLLELQYIFGSAKSNSVGSYKTTIKTNGKSITNY